MIRVPTLALALAATPALAAPPAGFEARVEQVRKASGTPGMAIAIVEDGQVTLAEGFGVRRAGGADAVDADTAFLIGSTAKAMTAAALATLVDAGKLKWDDHVVDHLPGFQMYDPWVTREMTVRDLLVHRSGLGLGAGDLLYVPRGSYSRAEIVRRLRFIKPATSFRSAYAYDNILYTVAGQLIEAVSGETWEKYVQAHVFAPVAMTHATDELETLWATPNRAFPHARYGGVTRGTGPMRALDERDQLPQASAPAGLIAASANDMAKWLQVQLAGGMAPGGGRVFSEATGKEMWTPVTPIPITPLPEPVAATTPTFDAYALGWEVRDYRGARIVWHAGGLFGMTSMVVLIPEKKVGFAIELNSEETEPRQGLMWELIDHYLGLPPQDWPAKFKAYRAQRIAAAQAVVARKAAAPAKVGPSLPLARYAGRFVDPWYGTIAIGSDARGLTVDFTPTPRMRGAAGALSIRHLHRALRRRGDRARVFDLRARRGWQGRTDHRQAGVAHRRLQLRLRRSGVRARAGQVGTRPMKTPLFALLALLLVAATPPRDAPLAPVPVPAADAAAQPAAPSGTPALTAADVGAWLDGYMPSALQSGKIAGAEVAVVKDGQVLFLKGYGYADVAAKTPMDPNRTLMRIGSTSKLLTWTAVMQQVEAGRIDLNADVNRYLDFRITPPGRAVTMNDLMRHRGGFEEGLKDLLASDPKLAKSTDRYLKENVRPFLFAPGEAPAYSNYGVALAGYIVQRVSGEPFESYVQQHILSPLGMAHTTFVQPLPPALAPLMSKGYPQSDQPPGKFELVVTAPAGSVSATAGDMARFMIAHLQDGRFGGAQILKPETARFMHRPNAAPMPGFDTMAHGFFWGVRNGTAMIGHGGDTIVFHTDLSLLPDKGVGIFVSFNSRGERNAVYGARERLFDLFMDRYFPGPGIVTPPAIGSAAEDAQALAGHYESSRRVETGFISLFYLIQQDQVVANADGTIGVSSIEGKRFRETAPGLWQEVDGPRRLRIAQVGGRRAILDSANPVGVLQAAPFWRGSGVFLIIAGGTLLVLLLTVLLWPVAAWLRRRDGLAPVATGRAALARRITRIAALADLLYLAGWYTMLAPILGNHLDVYNDQLDGTVRALQVAAVVPIAAAAIGVWNAAVAFRRPFAWGIRLRAVLVALALIAFLWVAWMGGLIGWSLNY